MPFPGTIDELVQAGYRHEDQANCRGVWSREWWTTPRGKKMPFDVDSDGNAEPHFATCPNAKDFRK